MVGMVDLQFCKKREKRALIWQIVFSNEFSSSSFRFPRARAIAPSEEEDVESRSFICNAASTEREKPAHGCMNADSGFSHLFVKELGDISLSWPSGQNLFFLSRACLDG